VWGPLLYPYTRATCGLMRRSHGYSYPCIHNVHNLVVWLVAPLSISVKISKFLSKVTSVGSCSSRRQCLSIASDCTTNFGFRVEQHERSMKTAFRPPVRLIAFEILMESVHSHPSYQLAHVRPSFRTRQPTAAPRARADVSVPQGQKGCPRSWK
jgi:hypothetical protein